MCILTVRAAQDAEGHDGRCSLVGHHGHTDSIGGDRLRKIIHDLSPFMRCSPEHLQTHNITYEQIRILKIFHDIRFSLLSILMFSFQHMATISYSAHHIKTIHACFQIPKKRMLSRLSLELSI